MSRSAKHRSLFGRLKAGLEEGIQFARGEINLRTTTVAVPPPDLSPEAIMGLRRKLKMSRTAFAQLLNVSPKTLQTWEEGARRPARASLRLLQLAQQHPEALLKVAQAS